MIEVETGSAIGAGIVFWNGIVGGIAENDAIERVIAGYVACNGIISGIVEGDSPRIVISNVVCYDVVTGTGIFILIVFEPDTITAIIIGSIVCYVIIAWFWESDAVPTIAPENIVYDGIAAGISEPDTDKVVAGIVANNSVAGRFKIDAIPFIIYDSVVCYNIIVWCYPDSRTWSHDVRTCPWVGCCKTIQRNGARRERDRAATTTWVHNGFATAGVNAPQDKLLVHVYIFVVSAAFHNDSIACGSIVHSPLNLRIIVRHVNRCCRRQRHTRTRESTK